MMGETFASAVYVLCFLASTLCALLLARSYRRTGARLLLWSSLCFISLALNNLTLVADLLVFPEQDLKIVRLSFSLIAASVLLFGFIWDLEEQR
jgi:hypothetical protein